MRTVDDSEIDKLMEAGATEVVPEVLEGSLMLASHSLLVLGVPLNRVLKRIRAVREERYGLFRGFFHGATDTADAAENVQARLHTVVLPDRAWAVGHTLAEIEPRQRRRDHRRAPARRALAAPRRRIGGSRRATCVVLLGRPEELDAGRGEAAARAGPEGHAPAMGRPNSSVTDRGSLRRREAASGYNRFPFP